MPIYPTDLAASELLPGRVWLELGGPKPPLNPLARLIASSLVNRDTTPADSVRAAQANAQARRLARLAILAKACHVSPRILTAIHSRLASLRHAA